MSERELPEGWAETGLLTIADLVRGVTYGKEDAVSLPRPGYISVLRANNLQATGFHLEDLVYVPKALVSDTQMVKKDDIVVATSSGSISIVGKAVQAKKDLGCGFGAFCGIVRPASDSIGPFLGNYFQSQEYRSFVSNAAQGVNINNLKRDHFEQVTLPIPPLPEQKRIVAKLDALLGKLSECQARLDRVPALLKRFRQAVLAAATSGRLTEDWRGLNGRTFPTNSKLFGEIAISIRGGSTAVPTDTVTDFPILRSSSVRPRSIDFADVRYLAEEQSGDSKNYLVAGDLLFTRLNGTVDFVGNCALVHGSSSSRYQYPDRLYCAKVGNLDLARYLVIYFSSPAARAKIEELAKSSAGHKRITIEDVKNLEVLVPDSGEQLEIVRRVESLFALADRIEARYLVAKAKADRLQPALLAKAFRGELVAQDPNDEAASILLERVKAEKASTTSKPKTGRKPR